MCSFKIETENSSKNTNAPPVLPIGNAPGLHASKGCITLHNIITVCCTADIALFQLADTFICHGAMAPNPLTTYSPATTSTPPTYSFTPTTTHQNACTHYS